MNYNVLVLGSGGREHALAWKISKSKKLEKLFCLPGNPGMEKLSELIPGSVEDFNLIKSTVLEHKIDLVVCGPENPLVNGIRDFFENDPSLKKVLFIGPAKTGAMLEGSKKFAKTFMQNHNIPTARYKTFTKGEEKEAADFLETLNPPYVLKADGLAAGKGVLILDDKQEAIDSINEMFSGKFSDAGKTVLIEEFLSGIEASVFVLTDGKDYMILPEAKDYKRISENDTGLNTGGMGAVSPVPFADKAFMQKVENRIIKPTIQGLQEDKIPYCGFIFIGLMKHDNEPYVIEYNVRMGDPETEAVMPRIESDFLSHLIAAAEFRLSEETIKISKKTALTVIAVSKGYPESYKKGYTITGLDNMETEDNVILFHSGTKSDDLVIKTAGGRVLAITALSNNIIGSRAKAYDNIKKIEFDGINYRRDIGFDLLK
ncbi:MAG: phosphoribosylamine--glycine ligase [Bacteroidales bacterium]